MSNEKEDTISIYEQLERQDDNLLAFPEESEAPESFSPTIFDDVFRTIVEDFPELLLALINEIFGTDYPEDTPIEQYRNEHMEPGGKIITDSILRIGNQFYHIECQSDDDANIVIRMVAYDISIALDHPITLEAADNTGKKRKVYRIRFPQSCVMYIRDNGRIPDELEVEIEFADGFVYKYHTPTINVQHYTKKELFEKRLLAFLPYYVLRYEDQIKQMEEQESYDEQTAGSILEDLRDVCLRLRQETEERNKSVLYGGLIELIQRITRYVFRKTPQELRKGVSEAMGGQVIELKTMKVFRAGREEGIEEGEARGRAEGEAHGVDRKGREVYMNCRSRGMSIEDAMAIAGISSSLAEEAEKEWQKQVSASV